MQAAATRSASAAGFSGRTAPVLAAPARRRLASRGQEATTTTRGALGSEGLEFVSTVSQLASTAAVAYGAYVLLSQQSMAPEQDRLEQRNQEPCPVCSGTGFEPCMCRKWSDGDVGCSSCNKSGYMRCRGCGGGGTAVPLLVKVRK